nr:MAG TPA: hypothetical protein [Caudoviricetes sp.]
MWSAAQATTNKEYMKEVNSFPSLFLTIVCKTIKTTGTYI